MKHEDTLSGAWLDFYALLSVQRDSDANELRRLIGACYADASQNLEHRDLGRRMFYQAMVERVLPQCRRVLLNPETRARYDEQHALHEANAPGALSYVAFMAGLSGATRMSHAPVVAPDSDAAPLASAETGSQETGGAEDADAAPPDESGPVELDFDALPERVREDVRQEIDLARAVVETLEHGFAFDLLPSRAVSHSDSALQTAAPRAATPPPTSSKNERFVPKNAVTTFKAKTPEPELHPQDDAPLEPSLVQPSLEAPEAKRPFKRGTWDSDAKIPRQRPDIEAIVGVAGQNGLVQDDLTFDADRSRSQRKAARPVYRPRVTLDEALPAHDGNTKSLAPAKRGRGSSVLTSTARLLLTSLVAALFVIVLQRDGSQPATASNHVEAPRALPAPRAVKPRVVRRTTPVKPKWVAKKPAPIAVVSTIPQSTVPQSTIPQNTVPETFASRR